MRIWCNAVSQRPLLRVIYSFIVSVVAGRLSWSSEVKVNSILRSITVFTAWNTQIRHYFNYDYVRLEMMQIQKYR